MESDSKQLHLKHLLAMGEGIRVEYKEARTSFSTSLFETICAMLNRDGGDILLEVDDQGRVLGVEPGSIAKMKTDMVNLSNNPQKLDPPFILFPVKHVLDDNEIMQISVPASSQVHKTNGVVFDRSNDGDFRVTNASNYRVERVLNPERVGERAGEKVGERLGERLGENEENILALLSKDPTMLITELSEHLRISTTAVENNIKKLKKRGLLERKGPAKGGRWEVRT